MTDAGRSERNTSANRSQGRSMPGLSDDDDDEQPDDRIILSGGNQTSYWRLPTNMKRCPISSCGRKFEHTELLAAHFNKHHAKKTTHCDMCDSPIICANYPNDLESHCRRIHPKIKVEPVENKMPSETDIDAMTNDIITLTGLEITTLWKFPQINYCPHPSCQEDFEDRSEAISHFISKHSDHAILCSICIPPKPVYTYSIDGFTQHYRNHHPDADIPYGFNESSDNHASDQMQQKNDEVPVPNNEKIDDKKNDLITLSACGVTTQYPFPPRITRCPKLICSENFETHLMTKNHYIAEHASESIFCTICQKPLTVHKPKSFVEHFRRMHPHNKVPFGFDDDNNISTVEVQDDSVPEDDVIVLTACGRTTYWQPPPGMLKCPTMTCKQNFKMRSNLIRHFRKNHAEGSVLCKLCQKPIRVHNSFDQFRSHYRRMHPFAIIPFTDGVEEATFDSEQMDVSTDNVDDIVTLKGLGLSTKWRIPPNTNRCPVNKCREAFENRSALTSHYQEQHAAHMVLCEICNKPLTTPNLNTMLKHYRERHPNAGKPTNLIRNVRKSMHDRPTEDISDGSESDDETDLIILNGLGQRMEYHFPKRATICPIYACRKEFGIRAMAIDHFKSRHSKNSVFCEICNRPVSAKVHNTFLEHYKKLHPDVQPPEFLKNPIPKEDKNDTVDEDIDDNDLIKLEGAGIITHWKFPVLTKCPVMHCGIEFALRSHAIIHYKQQHAKKAILCELCDKPIAVHNYSANTFIVHYQQTHSFKRIPYGLDDRDTNSSESQGDMDDEGVDDSIELKGLGSVQLWQFPKNISRCPSKNCKAAFKSRSVLLDHYRAIHAPTNVLCPICIKPFYATQPSNVYQHFKTNHKNMDIPTELNAMMSNDNENNEEDDLIQLNGCGQITHFRFPQNTTCCPVYNCSVDSGFRSRAIAHYKRKHAKDMIFCEECQKPVGAKCLNTFKKHYDTIHPNIELPEFVKNPQYESDSEDDEVDDLILLYAECGIQSEWRFPKKLKCCPTPNCNPKFENRAQAIFHYRKYHSIAILCPGSGCDKPISAKILSNFMRHFKEKHPDEELPPHMKEKILTAKKQGSDADRTDDTDESDSDEQNDWITLTGANRIRQWQFPDVLTCPVSRCYRNFETRLQAMRHYKKIHSMNFQYCSICAKPVCAHTLARFKKHFEITHPNMSLPSDYFSDDEDDLIQLNGGNVETKWKFPKSIRKRCPAENCDMEFGVRSDIRDHFKKRHTSDHFYCKQCDKIVFACDQNDFDKHRRNAHSNVKQPSGSKKSFNNTPRPSTSKVNLTSSTENDSEDYDDEVIELRGLGTLTLWRLPIGVTKCPIRHCDKQFDMRLDLVNHFKECHAKHGVYCTICKKPVMSHDIHNIRRHYLRIHPNEKCPFKIDDQKSTQLPKPKLLRSSGVIEKIDELDDIITLQDCNNKQTVEWNFPDITQCPVELCRRELGSRLDAFNHFKHRHLKNAQYCSKCSEPIEVYRQEDVQEHEYRAHQSESDATSNASKPSSSSTENINQTPLHLSDDDVDTEDEIIILSGLDCITKYRFPLVKYCPLPSCMIIFGVRSDAITHFRKKHSRDTICCVVCKKAILVPEFELHYQQMHPKHDISMNFKSRSESPTDGSFKMTKKPTEKAAAIVKKESTEKGIDDEDLIVLEGGNQITKWRFPKDTKKCPALRCDDSFTTHSACRNHFKRVHAKHSIRCPECNKPYATQGSNPRNFLIHFQNAHPNSRLPFKFEQASTSTAVKEDDGHDVDDSDTSDSSENITGEDVITLNGLGITTKWRIPDNITTCPVFSCQQVFKMRSTFISHYKENHANGSILCPVCVPPKPIRVNKTPRDYTNHFERVHPNHEVPFDFVNKRKRSKKIVGLKGMGMANENSTTKNESKEVADQNDDLIKLTGMNKIGHWKFPPNLKKCPLVRCKAGEFKSRSLAIQHYKANHATTSVLCFICKKPISVTNSANYRTHFKSRHPHVKFSLSQNPKIESSSQSKPKAVQPNFAQSKHSVKVLSSTIQSSDKKRRCTKCGIKFMNLSRHMMEMHSNKRILCPLISCDFTSKRLELIRRHWKSAHQNFRFPEIAPNSGFTYKTTSDDTQECISTSNATSDSQIDSNKQTAPRCKTERKADQSLLMPLDEYSESSMDDDSSAAEMVQKNRQHIVRNKRRRQISESSNTSSSDYEIQKPGPKRFKLMKKHAKDSKQSSSTASTGSANGSTQNLSTISVRDMLDCSVTLEKLDTNELNKSNASHASNENRESQNKPSPVLSPIESKKSVSHKVSQPIKTNHSENMVINMEVDATETVAPIEEAVTITGHKAMEYGINIEPDPQLNYEHNQFYYVEQFNEPPASLLPQNFDANAYNAYEYNLNPNQLASYVDIQPNFQIKEEKMHALPPMLLHTQSDQDVIEILDSDEEEALNSRDSGRETNDTIIDADSSHIPTMGVLMMAKK